MQVSHIDHLVLTVADIERSVEFYTKVLGMVAITFGDNRRALQFGRQKINLHEQGREIVPHASRPTAGSADMCLLVNVPLEQVLEHLAVCGITPLTGIVPRTGAMGVIHSVYLNDPDGNLLELSCYE
ncbi:MAG: VOC family protein [Moraxella sp.]|nr:VOC family protein [Moraxella sp.]